LHSLFIFWTGSERILNPPEYKKMPMLIASAVTVIALYIGLSWILTQIVDRVYYAFFA
jgi:Co/Zn/Cd efflux system component